MSKTNNDREPVNQPESSIVESDQLSAPYKSVSNRHKVAHVVKHETNEGSNAMSSTGGQTVTINQANGNETVEEYEHSYVELDGTRVNKHIVIRRIRPDKPHPAAASVHKTSSHKVIHPHELSEFQRVFLERHNQYRARHQSPPLEMSRELCKYAQEWADNLAAKKQHVHRPSPKKYGENIFWKMSPNLRLSGHEPVDYWYDEVNQYDVQWYGGDPPRKSYKVSGHFTQLVWYSSKYLGVGLAMNGNSFYVVANYHPIGNCFTRYGVNVLKPIDEQSNQDAQEQQTPEQSGQ